MRYTWRWLLLITLSIIISVGCISTTQQLTNSSSGNVIKPAAQFEPGIYYLQPDVEHFAARLIQLDGGPTGVTINGIGFDIKNNHLVTVVDSTVRLTAPDGETDEFIIDGLYGLARPSLSPDASQVVVQATTRNFPPEEGPSSTDLGIYVIDLETQSFQRINEVDPTGQAESPEWFHLSNRIAYSSFSPETGVNLHVYNIDTGEEELELIDKGGLHIAVSPDDSIILNSIEMKVYDAGTGEQLYDLQDTVIAELEAAGYAIDFEHNGFDERDGYTLDGDFSPDGTSIVFDGSVTQGEESGILLAQINLDGSDFTILSDIIPVNPDFGNNNNFSQLTPLWLE